MSAIRTSSHAEQRIQQRGFRKTDIDLLLRCGTFVDDSSIVLTDVDVAAEIARRKREIQALERLRRAKVVIEGTTCVKI